MTLNSKQKGNQGERDFAELLRLKGLDNTARRNVLSGAGFQKSDVHNKMNYVFEVKRVEKLNIWKAEEQAQKDADQCHAVPSVPHRRNRGEWWISIPVWHWAELWKKAQEPKVENPDRQLRWAIEALINAAKKVLKLLK